VSGWVWAILSLCCWSAWSVIYSHALSSYSYPAIYVASATVAGAVSWLFVLAKHSPPFPPFGLAWILPVVALAGGYTQAQAFESSPPGLVTAILALNPAVVTAVMVLFGDRMSVLGWLGVGLCVAGVGLIGLSGRG
jgi:drug/metabolite transporter (DMT)-like permease